MTALVVGLWGSGEFAPWSEAPERWLLERAAGGDGSVLILPTASAPEGQDVFDRWGALGLEHYRGMGLEARVLPLKTNADANRPELVHELGRASMIYFSGGNPAYLARTLAGSAFWLGILDAMERGLAYAGCSAGVSALGELAGDSSMANLGERVWETGLRLFPGVSFGPHWDALDRFVPGLRDTIVASVPAGQRLLGIDEDTAVVGDGVEWHVMGSAGAHLYEDGTWREFPAGAGFHLAMAPA